VTVMMELAGRILR